MTKAISLQKALSEARPSLYEGALRGLLNKIRYGKLTLTTPSGRIFEAQGAFPGPQARVVLHDWRILTALLLQGDNGLATSYIAGHWSSPDLSAFLKVCVLNFSDVGGTVFSGPSRWWRRWNHKRRANSRAGAKRNIMAHYDLGNEFFARWLDENMLYSSALYETYEETLGQAQHQKVALIEEWLESPMDAKILEIGCGWGHLARTLGAAGAQVTGLTISPSQLDYAQNIIAKAGLEGRVKLALRDYRDENGIYDRIVSIEMIEAVGEAYWPDYFQALRARLKPGGRAVLQVITIAADRFDNYRRRADFIQNHIFPGGMLPTKAGLAALGAEAGLSLHRVKNFGLSYARTLADWRARFAAAWPELEAMGFDLRFRRLWDYYLCYCEAGFTTGSIDVGLYEFTG